MSVDLNRLEALLAAATPGEWTGQHEDFDGAAYGAEATVADYDCALVCVCHETREVDGVNRAGANSRLIAALHNAAPELIAIAKAVREWRAAGDDYRRGAVTRDKQIALDGARKRLFEAANSLAQRAAEGGG